MGIHGELREVLGRPSGALNDTHETFIFWATRLANRVAQNINVSCVSFRAPEGLPRTSRSSPWIPKDPPKGPKGTTRGTKGAPKGAQWAPQRKDP